MQLFDTVSLWLGRVEATLVGADIDLREGRDALRVHDAMRARACAHRALERVPGSPLALALLADACEMQGLTAELLVSLEQLAERIPSRPDVWLRLGLARSQNVAVEPESEGEAREALGRALRLSRPDSEVRPATLVALAELDVATANPRRAELWLDRLVPPLSDRALLLRARARLDLGDPARAAALCEKLADDPTSADLAYTRGQALALLQKPEAFPSLVRAYVLEHPQASRALSSAIGWLTTDPAAIERVRAVIEAHGDLDTPRFRAAFARARGDARTAIGALTEAVRAGDRDAAQALFDAALAEGDREALAVAVHGGGSTATSSGARTRLIEQARTFLAIVSSAAGGDGATPEARLDALALLDAPELFPLRRAEIDRVYSAWIPEATNGTAAPAAWSELLARISRIARDLGALDVLTGIATLAETRARPIRMAIVGEFNAGKSTFINALIGEDVAPTGVLPTTATLHHLRYAQDRIARIHLDGTGAPGSGPSERIVGFTDLKRAIKESGDHVVSVELLAPLPSLTRAEVIDTPGFNAPDARHATAARTSFQEADIVLWILDAAQALKATEGAILKELQHDGIPIQVFVNKADRLTPDERGRVLTVIEEGLAALGVASRGPLHFVSARLALAARTAAEGTANAELEASGWPIIDAWFERDIVAKSDELKERSLRRRARELAASLQREMQGRADASTTAATGDAQKRSAMRRRAFAIEDAADRFEQEVGGALATALERFRADVGGVTTSTPNRYDETPDASVQRYALDRAALVLADPIRDVMVRVGELDADSAERAAPITRSLSRTLARSAAGDPTPAAVGRSVASALVDLLLALGEPEGADTDARYTGLAEELGRMCALLHS